jgi:hypothetical protein
MGGMDLLRFIAIYYLGERERKREKIMLITAGQGAYR